MDGYSCFDAVDDARACNGKLSAGWRQLHPCIHGASKPIGKAARNAAHLFIG
jgi:hypothetical protein